MPVEYVIRPEEQLVECTVFGLFSDDDARRNQQQLRRDPEFKASFRQLSDFTRVTAFQLSSEGLRGIAAHSVFAPGVARAIIAPTDLGFGLARMFDAFASADGHTVRVFRERSEAVAWLDSTKKPAA